MSLDRSQKQEGKKRFGKKAPPKVEPEVIDASEDIDDGFFDRFIETAKGSGDKSFIVPIDENEPLLQVQRYVPMPTPIAEVIGAPGIPCGLITEVYGHPDSGKTTFCNEILKNTQTIGGIPILLLTELKYDLPRAQDMGLNVKRMMIRRPKTIEDVRAQLHDIITLIQKTKGQDKPVTIVWDSMAATPCEKELNEKRGDFAADNAAALTVLLRKTQAMIRDYSIAFVMINQISTKIGVSFGKKTQAKGGFAPKFYSALRIEFQKVGRLRAATDAKDSDFSAIKTVMEVEKNHLGTPFKTGEFAIDYKGFVFDRQVERKGGSKKVHSTKKSRDTEEGE
jgi:RecA/RadA recombinase